MGFQWSIKSGVCSINLWISARLLFRACHSQCGHAAANRCSRPLGARSSIICLFQKPGQEIRCVGGGKHQCSNLFHLTSGSRYGLLFYAACFFFPSSFHFVHLSFFLLFLFFVFFPFAVTEKRRTTLRP